MPTYEFKCSNCSHIFEDMTTISKRETTACPECNSPALNTGKLFAHVVKIDNTIKNIISNPNDGADGY